MNYLHKGQKGNVNLSTNERTNYEVRQNIFAEFVNCRKNNIIQAMFIVLLVSVMALVINFSTIDRNDSIDNSAVEDSSSNINNLPIAGVSSALFFETLQYSNDLVALNDSNFGVENIFKDKVTASFEESSSETDISLDLKKSLSGNTVNEQALLTTYQCTLQKLNEDILTQDNSLAEKYNELISQIDEFHTLGDEIPALYESVKTAKVCSKANKFNNSLQATYSQVLETASNIHNLYSQYEEEYSDLLQNVEYFNSYVTKLNDISSTTTNNEPTVTLSMRDSGTYTTSYSITSPSIEDISTKYSDFLSFEKSINSIASNSQKIADDFYNEVYYDMVHIGFAEAGCDWFPPEYICYVLNVIENRVESPMFKGDNVHDIIFARGQYAPTWDGNFYKEPTDQAESRVAEYLRGNFETGMPSNVVFQASFKQGNGVWKCVDGIYFCYKNSN